MKMKRGLKLLAVLAVFSLILAACGDDAGEGTTTTGGDAATTTTAAPVGSTTSARGACGSTDHRGPVAPDRFACVLGPA